MYNINQIENSKELFGYDLLNASMSYSSLKKINQSIEHWINAKIFRDEKPAYRLGNAIDSCLKSRDEYYKSYELNPYPDFRTDLAKHNRDEKKSKGITVLTAAEMEIVKGVRISFCQHPLLRSEIFGFDVINENNIDEIDFKFYGENGKDYFTEKRVDFYFKGQKCKCFMDFVRYIDDPLTPDICADFKTTTSIKDDAKINRDICDYGYYIQQYLYTLALTALRQKTVDFYLVFIETKAPHGIKIINYNEHQERAKMEINNGIELFKDWVINYNNPSRYWGYAPKVRNLQMPFWEKNK